MPQRIQIATHLSVEELEQRYRQAKEGVESRHYQIIWLLAQGNRTEEVAELTGYSRVGSMSWFGATTALEQNRWGINVIKIQVLLRCSTTANKPNYGSY